MENKRGYEFSFAWIFAVLVGGVIIFIAVYAASNFIKTFGVVKGSELGKEIGILLTPFETNIEEGKTNLIKTREETTIFNECEESGEFGVQKISASVKSRIGMENDNERGEKSSFKNRYLFSDKSIKGKEFYVLSKRFEFPFKVGDVIIAWSDKQKYCFVGASPEIKEDIKGLDLKNVVNVSSISEARRTCPENSIKVCFMISNSECNIIVDNGKVTHKTDTRDKDIYYDSFNDNNALLYAAIFSSPEIYDCQIKRLMNRASNLAELYTKKFQFLEARGCGASRLNSYFISYENEINSVADADKPDITEAEQAAEDLGRENEFLICKIF